MRFSLRLQPDPSIDPPEKLLKTVKRVMLARIIILSLLLSITFIFQISEERLFFVPLANEFYYFIGFFYLVTIFYALLLRRVKDLLKFVFWQMLLDQFFITALIYFTGGKDSIFPIVYIFSIIGSSTIFYIRGAFFSASTASFLFGMILLLQFYGCIDPPGRYPRVYEPSQVFYTLIHYMAAFYIVAFLSSLVAEELKKKKRELIQKQEDYDQLEAFNRNIVQSLDSGLLTIDLERRVNFLNRTAEKILGMEEKELKGLALDQLFPIIGAALGRDANRVPAEYQRYETPFVGPEGRRMYLGFSISPLTAADGSMIGHTLIFQDITRFKEMEEHVKRVDRMAAIGQLAAGMAHEIRNPLASISGSIQMLKSELTSDPSFQKLMDIILRESERLNAIIRDFLLFAQPPRMNKRLCHVGSLIDETVELFRSSDEVSDSIKIKCSNSHNQVEAVVDPDQMKQVFWNLLINAAQAMAKGGEISIELTKGTEGPWHRQHILSEKQARRSWVKIAFTDTGCGISKEEKERIFEPFYTTKERGTGLGLSIVHKIIENHNGVIKVDSEVGKGSTFAIYLPADEGNYGGEQDFSRG